MSELARVDARDLPHARLIEVRGEVDLSNAREVMDAIAANVPHDAARVVVDLGRTTYIDSAAIAMIFRLAERLGHRRQEVHLVAPAEAPIRAVLELTNVDRVIPLHEVVTDVPGAT